VEECIPSNDAARVFVWNGTNFTDTGLTNAESIDAIYYHAPSNSIFVGGEFTEAGGVAGANNIAQYDFDVSGWNAVGGGVNGRVRAITHSSTQLFVGGDFSDAGGDLDADKIAVFNGSTFESLESGIDNGIVYALEHESGKTYVGGTFTSINGNAQLEGLAVSQGGPPVWSAAKSGGLGTGVSVYSIVYDPGILSMVIGGDFAAAGTDPNAENIFRYSAATVFPISNGLPSTIYGVHPFSTTVFAIGSFSSAYADNNQRHVSYHNGVSWTALGSGLSGPAETMVGISNEIYVGGEFAAAGGVADTSYLAKWNGSTWVPLNQGLNGPVTALATDGSRVFIGGKFTAAN